MKRELEAWLIPAAAVALAAGILLGRAVTIWWPQAAMLLCAACACALLRGRGRFVAVQAMVLAAGALLGYAAYHPALPEEGDYVVSGVVCEEISLREDGQVRTMLTAVTLNGKPLHSRAYWSFYLREDESLPQELAPGRRVTVTARVYHPGGADNPGGYDFREHLLQRGATIGVYGWDDMATQGSMHPLGVAAAIRHQLSVRLMAVMGQDAGSYAATMLLGSRSLIPEEDRQAFSRLGIAHILSVSGFHVGVLAGLITWLMKRMHASRRLRFGCTTLLLAAYCVLTGLNAPVIRATCLYVLYEFGALRHRQRSRLHLLSASWIIQLVASPVQLTGLSLQLSYGAMLGLTLVAPWLEGQWTPRRGTRLWRMLCAAAGAQAGLLLPQLYWFHELPLLALALNPLVIALSSGLLMLCWVMLALLAVPGLGVLAGQLTAWLLNGMLVVVRLTGGVQGITLWTHQAGWITALAWLVLMYAASWWWPGRGRAAALIASATVLMLSVMPWPHTGTDYIQFSVGAEDAAVLRDGRITIAIDTGEDGEALAAWLHQRRLSLDALVLTHLHIDHAGGIDALLDSRIPVRRCYLPWGAEQCAVDEGILAQLAGLQASGTELVYLSRGDTIPLPGGSLTVLWPEKDRVRPGQDANGYSLTLLAQLHGSSMLLTGDLDGAYEMYAATPADVLKAAHHGSDGSTSWAFLQQVQPQLIILSCGDEERVAAMDARRGSAALVDTHYSGAVMIDFDTDGFTVSTMR